MNKIVIFGATGMTGLCVVEAAVKKGLTIRAFVRDASKVPESYKDKVEVVVGNVLNQPDVDSAVQGMDGVVVALGTRNDLKPTTDMSEGMKNIITAMKTNNVEKVSVCLSAFLLFDKDKVPPIFTDVTADHQRMWDVLKESGLKYVSVFPPHIADTPSSEYAVEYNKSPGRSISKWDLGKFLVECLSQPEHYGKVVGLATIKH